MYNINSEKAVKKSRTYFHVTDVKNIEQIRRNGIKANKDGHIFVFNNSIVAETIAANQCGLIERFALFMIDSRGVTGKVIMDRVAEFSAPYQRIIIQDQIHKKYITFFASVVIDYNEPSPWDIFLLKKLEGLTPKKAKKVFKERRAELLQYIKNKKGGSYAHYSNLKK